MFDIAHIKQQMGELHVTSNPEQTKLYIWTIFYDEIKELIPDAIIHDQSIDLTPIEVPNQNSTNRWRTEKITRLNKLVEVDWTYENAVILRKIGASALSPILRDNDYDWPGKLEPYTHQKTTAAFLTINPRSYCLSDMGTGKTLATLHAINYLVKIGKISKVLIVCPLSVMRDAWQSTLLNMGTDLTCEILHSPNKEKRISLLSENPAQIHIINPDGVQVIQDELLKQDYDLVVIDELTTYKTHSTVRHERLNPICAQARYVWGITGTPVPNDASEAYGQVKIVTPDKLEGVTYNSFKEKLNHAYRLRLYTDTYSTAIDDIKSNPEVSLEIVSQYFSPAIRIRKEDCLKELKKEIYEDRYCELSISQIRALDRLKKDGMIKNESGESFYTSNGADELNKLTQICCGAVYDKNHNVIKYDNKSKLDETLEIIRQGLASRTEKGKGKTLVFLPFISALDCVYDFLKKKKIRVAKICSSVTEKERTEIFNKLQQTDEIDVIVAIPSTMSHGITATNASQIVWFGPTYSSETYMQACNRIIRAGQTQQSIIYHLYSEEFEKRIYQALQNRKANQQILLAMYKEYCNGK